MRTPFDEPFAPAQGRYDVEIRFRDDKGQTPQITLFVNGRARGPAWRSPGTGRRLYFAVVREVEIRQGDEVRDDAEGRWRRESIT